MGISTKTFFVIFSAALLITYGLIAVILFPEYAFEYYVALTVTLIYLELVKKPDRTD